MDIEIELKLLATPSAQQDILTWLKQTTLNYRVFAGKQLRNDYFETPQRTLRKHDIGLRIRGHNGEFEQTVKTKGRVIAGMHQRPEYNVPLPTPDLKLDLFEREIWPQSINVTELESQLYTMFSTDFLRHTYLITWDNTTQIELVFDIGKITANGRHVDICEIELELKSGEPRQLFELAMQLVNITPLRFGLRSKAARGYQLADNRTDEHYEPPAHFTVLPDKPVIENAVFALEQALSVWQQGEAAFYQSQNIDDWRTMRAGISLVQEIIALFQTSFASCASNEAGEASRAPNVLALQKKLNTLLMHYQQTDSLLAAQYMQAHHFLEQNDVPHHAIVNLQLKEFIENRNLLTMLNDVVANSENMRVQLSIGAFCMDVAKKQGERTGQMATHDSKQPTPRELQQFISDMHLSNEGNASPPRNRIAACKVLWGEVNLAGALNNDINPWSVLRREDKITMRNALKNLLEEQVLTLEVNIEKALLAWCANN
ncbi:Inorganic triphosphatase [Paraglaciecola mesophila]|uniref:Inorganic triphosphatase n=1 Tax=Paraglaciecola mesophila TaxID=197222 RepID=A0A857JP42_9ALTE|nr:CYTH domain-containing protein [Paraglaciecola mesophila]QHJ12801.1 Inorganic triphosphatase [Paraglaciecola mesophila]